MIAVDEHGIGRGSARSVPGFDLLAGLRACEGHLSRYGGHAAAAGLEIAANEVDAFRAALCAYTDEALRDSEPALGERVDAVVGGESLGIETAEEFARLGPFGVGNPEIRLLVPSARIRDVTPMGEDGKHARFSLVSGPKRALGVAFGVNGSLAKAGEGPHDLSVRLEVNHWNGSVEPRVILGRVYPQELPGGEKPLLSDSACASPAGAAEWWDRVEAEQALKLDVLAGPVHVAADRRVVKAHGRSPIALLADLVSAGDPVLAICADALRRRGLAQRAVPPRRFGVGDAVIACSRCGAEARQRGILDVLEAGSGLVLTDWAALSLDPHLAADFERVVLIDPPPTQRLRALAGEGRGELHLSWGEPEVEFAIQLQGIEWPSRKSLARLYASLREELQSTAADKLQLLLSGSGATPLTAEQAGRRLRVLSELQLVAWEGTRPADRLRAVSSEGTDLERSKAYLAYRALHDEGVRFLESQKPRM